MHEEQPPPPSAAHLTDLQKDRAEYARRDLEACRAEDLAQLDAADLILLVERLRGRLGDTLELLSEITDSRV